MLFTTINVKKQEDQTIETQPLNCKKHVSEAHFVKKKDKFRENDQAKTASKFQCPYCKSKFSQKYNLNRHIKKMHEENIETTKEKPDLIHYGKNSLNENNNSSKNESAEHIEKPSDCEHDNNNSINEFDSSSDIHELEGTFECSECAQKFSSQSI